MRQDSRWAFAWKAPDRVVTTIGSLIDITDAPILAFAGGVDLLFGIAILTAKARSLAQDLKATREGKWRRLGSDGTLFRLESLCETIRRFHDKSSPTNLGERIVVQPFRRNLAENLAPMEAVLETAPKAVSTETGRPAD